MQRPFRPQEACAALDRRAVLRGAFALGTVLLAARVRACEFGVATLTIVHPWVRATGPGATSAAVCMSFKDVLESDRLVAAETPVAERVELAGPDGTIEIPAGTVTELTERGREFLLHGLQYPLEMGRQFPLTLGFAKGGQVRASLNVDFVFR